MLQPDANKKVQHLESEDHDSYKTCSNKFVSEKNTLSLKRNKVSIILIRSMRDFFAYVEEGRG